MKEKRTFWKKIEESKLRQLLFFVVVAGVQIVSFIVLYGKCVEISSQRYNVTENKNIVKYVEKIDVVENEMIIHGWCFHKDMDSSKDKIQVFIRNLQDEDDTIWFEVEDVGRADIKNYYGDEVNHYNSGFKASANLKKIDVSSNDYEIFIKLSYEDEVIGQTEKWEKKKPIKYENTVSTDRYIVDGSLAVSRQKEANLPKTTFEELNEVIEKGQIVVYRKDIDMYVYIYAGKIYWVAGERFCFEKDGTTRIQCMLYTNRVSSLPERRLELGRVDDNIEFDFENKEIKTEEDYPYRVAVCDIPTMYPVTCVLTGGYVDGEWQWKEYFNIDIRMFRKDA